MANPMSISAILGYEAGFVLFSFMAIEVHHLLVGLWLDRRIFDSKIARRTLHISSLVFRIMSSFGGEDSMKQATAVEGPPADGTCLNHWHPTMVQKLPHLRDRGTEIRETVTKHTDSFKQERS